MAVEIPGVVLVELFLQFGLLGDERVEVGIGFGELGVDLIEAREHFDDGRDRLFHNLDDCFGFIEFGFLLEVAVGVAFGLRDLADVVFVDACDDAQQGGFARAVKTEHADLGAVVEAERNIAQDHFVADGDESSHFVHGVDYKGFVGHSGVILLYVLNTNPVRASGQVTQRAQRFLDDVNPPLFSLRQAQDKNWRLVAVSRGVVFGC